MNAKGGKNEEKQEQDENTRIYKLFLAAKECNNMDMERSAVELLAENYKKCLHLIMQEAFCLIYQKNICRIQNWQRLPTTSLERDAQNMLQMLLSVIMEYKLRISDQSFPFYNL